MVVYLCLPLMQRAQTSLHPLDRAIAPKVRSQLLHLLDEVVRHVSGSVIDIHLLNARHLAGLKLSMSTLVSSTARIRALARYTKQRTQLSVSAKARTQRNVRSTCCGRVSRYARVKVIRAALEKREEEFEAPTHVLQPLLHVLAAVGMVKNPRWGD